MNVIPNPQIDLAYKYVCQTNKHIFLTGKAGTGKTTFLRQIRREVNKRMAVVAPTGVAAINAEGVTIHSLFQLPFGTLVPGQASEAMKQRRFSRKKIKLLKSLDLLIIDEISMVRADVLDAIDEVLRRYRDFFQPFGGVQLLMIGDLHQLPPVVKPQDWELMRPHYQTPYFFGSLALQKTDAVTIELKHIYRQSDSRFINLLNKVRDNQIDESVLEMLNSRYQDNFQPKDSEGYITLSSHNATAQEINAKKLKKIRSAAHYFKAEISGDFPAQAYPTDLQLEFKEGAQVMFIKNDLSPDKLYYNGKIGRITKIDNEGGIYVNCPGYRESILAFPAEWKNVKYTLNETTKEVNEEVIGTFTQYPLKLAWAITIHKSQGLTFEKVIIDAQAAFAHGQVYVALSRCKSFEGIVLRSEIVSASVKTDRVVRNYTEESQRNEPDEAQLLTAKKEYQQSLLRDLFDFKIIKNRLDQLRKAILENEKSLQGNIAQESAALKIKARDQVISFAEKFKPQLENYFRQEGLPEENEALKERLQKASAYFSKQLKEELLAEARQLQILTDNKAIEKKVKEALEELEKALFIKNACFEICKEQFVAQSYVEAKVNAELDFQKTPSSAPVRPRILKDIAHPELYALLTHWRTDTADELEIERYSIAPTKTLLEIAEVLPTSSASLKRISGIGKKRIAQFGKDILEIVLNYCEDKQAKTDQLQLATGKAPKAPKAPKPDTKAVSFELYQSGKSIEEIAKERGFVRSTIESHLAHFIGKGEVEVSAFVEKEKIEKIKAYFEKAESKSFSEAISTLGTGYSYGELRMVMASMEEEEA